MLNDAQIKDMTDCFLSWKLPNDFGPDNGISFDKSRLHPNHWPVGTNLLTATQAEAMIRHMLDALSPSEQPEPVAWRDVLVEIEKAFAEGLTSDEIIAALAALYAQPSEQTGGGGGEPVSNPYKFDAEVKWLHEAARYFAARDTKGEDAAHWANVYNAENANKLAERLAALSTPEVGKP